MNKRMKKLLFIGVVSLTSCTLPHVLFEHEHQYVIEETDTVYIGGHRYYLSKCYDYESCHHVDTFPSLKFRLK